MTVSDSYTVSQTDFETNTEGGGERQHYSHCKWNFYLGFVSRKRKKSYTKYPTVPSLMVQPFKQYHMDMGEMDIFQNSDPHSKREHSNLNCSHAVPDSDKVWLEKVW